MKHRRERLNALLKEELGKIFLKELNFENSIVTVMEVKVSEDLLNAEVQINVIPFSKLNETADVLRQNRNRLRHLLMKKINIKQIPKLNFEINKHQTEGNSRIEKFFKNDKIK